MSVLDISNVVEGLSFIDQADRTVYDVYVYDGNLYIDKMHGYSNNASENYIFEDNSDGRKFLLYVLSGILIIKQIED